MNDTQPVDEANNVIIDENYDERDAKKADGQNPMDFAANIEKVKEVKIKVLNAKRRY